MKRIDFIDNPDKDILGWWKSNGDNFKGRWIYVHRVIRREIRYLGGHIEGYFYSDGEKPHQNIFPLHLLLSAFVKTEEEPIMKYVTYRIAV